MSTTFADDIEKQRHDLLEGFVEQARSACERAATLINNTKNTRLEVRLASSDFLNPCRDECSVTFLLAEERMGWAARIRGAWKPMAKITISGSWNNPDALVVATIYKPGRRKVPVGNVGVEADRAAGVPFDLGRQIFYRIGKAVADGHLVCPAPRSRVREARLLR